MIAEASEAISIREVCKRYGVSLRALRFYQQKGLLTPSRVARVRHFGEQELARLERILVLKKLGLTLREIALTLQSPAEGPLGLSRSACEQLIDRLEKRREAVDAALLMLEQLAAPQDRQD